MDNIEEDLIAKIKVLSETIWERRADWPNLKRWLSNFSHDSTGQPSERLHALHLLSHFTYFGDRELRELVRSMYRDLIRYPIVARIREANNRTTDSRFIEGEYQKELMRTRFLGVGNPSESGCHILYYFRQENGLPTDLFINAHQIFTRTSSPPVLGIKDKSVARYLFIDDFCGSGEQARDYSRDLLQSLRELDRDARLMYYALAGTTEGLRSIRSGTLFDEARSVFEMDESFRCFASSSRYFLSEYLEIDKGFAEAMCLAYGRLLVPGYPLGYADGQLLLGFHHNTPDNTLPIIWVDNGPRDWKPIFRRYGKLTYQS